MIVNSFDGNSKEIIEPAKAIAKVENFPETVITAFSQKFEDLILSSFDVEQVSYMKTCIVVPIYKFNYKGKEIGFYHTLLGGPASGALLEEIIAKGAKNILFFGSCGSLDEEYTGNKLIVPTHAYRDEGTSYHYAPPDDYIEVKTAEKLAEIFDEIGISYCKMKTWTTDAFYRETKNNMEARKKDGCSVVEMECASIMAIADFRKANVYQFLYTADCLDGNEWNRGTLGNMADDVRESILYTAIETAVRL
ncbi:MAG: nucleoside phosphorylase [Clostridia bacterium]|nr:nucleoside phosphorylase [Clostridia bacterium]